MHCNYFSPFPEAHFRTTLLCKFDRIHITATPPIGHIACRTLPESQVNSVTYSKDIMAFKLILFITVATFLHHIADAQFNPKLMTYEVVTEYASTSSGAECSLFNKFFTASAKVLSPTGLAPMTPAAFCAKVMNAEMTGRIIHRCIFGSSWGIT